VTGPISSSSQEAAIHEAAHAVVAWHHGLTVHAVSIVAEEGSDGVAVHRNPWYGLTGSPADELHAAVIAAEVSYAGELAVQAYLGHRGNGNEEDIAQISDCLQRVCDSRDQLRLMAEWIEQRVRDLLATEPIRDAVVRVAAVLGERGTLDGAEFLEVVDSVD
jgi:hypothetical protein